MTRQSAFQRNCARRSRRAFWRDVEEWAPVIFLFFVGTPAAVLTGLAASHMASLIGA